MWKTLKGLLQIVRPFNCLMFFAGTSVGGIMAVGVAALRWSTGEPLVIAAVSATLIGAGGNVLNDLFDIEIDRVNRPGRSLPSGAISRSTARILWIVLGVAGVATAAVVSMTHLIIAVTSLALLYAYNARLKSVPVLGNVVVGVIVGTSLAYGALSVGPVFPAAPAMFFAGLTTLSREATKDVEDLVGDLSRGTATLPVRIGPERTLHLVATLLLATVGLTPVPYLLYDYGGLYLLLMLFGDAFLLMAAWSVLPATDRGSAKSASRWIKLAMVVGLAAFAASRVGLP